MHDVLYLCKQHCLQSFLEEAINARAMSSCLLVEWRGLETGDRLLSSTHTVVKKHNTKPTLYSY